MPNDAPMPPVVEPAKTLVSARTARRRRALTVAGGVLALFALWELATGFVAYTSDAYVRSDLISVAPEVTGRIVAVVVHDNQPVAAGDLLAKIDPEPFRLARDAAQASLREAAAHIVADQDATHIADAQRQVADAALTYAQETIRRVQALQADSVASRAQLDDANAGLRRATADVAAASGAQAKAQQLLAADAATQQRLEAELALAEWRLDRTRIVAPGDGTINNLTLRVGDMARAAEPLIGVIDAHAWRINANYKQYLHPALHRRRNRMGVAGQPSMAPVPRPDRRHRPRHQPLTGRAGPAALCRAHHRLDPSAAAVPGDDRPGRSATRPEVADGR